MIVSLNEFLRTGSLGDLRTGMSREEVQNILGEPDETGYTSRKYPLPSIFVYGTIEFVFRQQPPRELIRFSWKAGWRGAFRLTSATKISDWAFTPDWTFEQIEDYLRERDLSFEYSDKLTFGEDRTPSLVLASGVAIIFNEGKVFGVYE